MVIATGGEHGVRIPVFNGDTVIIPAGRIVSFDTSVAPRESTGGEVFIPAVVLYDSSNAVGISQEQIGVGEFGLAIVTGLVMCETDGTVTAGNSVCAAAGGQAALRVDGTIFGEAMQADFTESIESDFGTNTKQVALCMVAFASDPTFAYTGNT